MTLTPRSYKTAFDDTDTLDTPPPLLSMSHRCIARVATFATGATTVPGPGVARLEVGVRRSGRASGVITAVGAERQQQENLDGPTGNTHNSHDPQTDFVTRSPASLAGQGKPWK